MTLKEKYDAICAFGPLSFARFHPWVRHLKIQLTLNENKDNIRVDFFGACTKFDHFTIYPTKATKSHEASASKETMEKYLFDLFLEYHLLDGKCIIFDEWTLGKAMHFTSSREAVYLDYKFAKAAALADVSQVEKQNQ